MHQPFVNGLRSMHRLFAVASLSVIALGVSAQTPPTDETGFTEFVAQVLKREVGEEAVSVKGPLTLGVGPLQANLDRIFAFCRRNEVTCASEIERYAKGAAQVLKQQGAPIDKSAVRVVVRTSTYIKRALESMGGNAPSLQSRPLVDGLVAIAVLDTPRAVRPLDDRDLRKLDMTQDQVFELGISNLLAEVKPLLQVAKPAAGGQIGSITGSVYEVGRAAVASHWAPLAEAQKGILLIALPTTDLVLYISESTPTAVDALRALSRHTAMKAPNPLSPTAVLRWTDAGWESVP